MGRKMDSIEEATVRSDGSVKIRYYFGETILIPEDIILKYGIRCWGSLKDKMDAGLKHQIKEKEVKDYNGRV